MFEVTKENLVLYAAKNYYNPTSASTEDFKEDLKRLKYIKRLINKYFESDKLSERLILNHLIILYNVFGIEAANNILEYSLTDLHWTVVKPCLIYLRYIDNNQFTGVSMDPNFVNALRNM